MIESSLMKLTHRGTSQPGSGFNAIVGCDRSVPVHGIPMRIYHEIMHEYSSSKTSSGQNVRFVAVPRKREAQFRLVYRVEAGVDPDIPQLL